MGYGSVGKQESLPDLSKCNFEEKVARFTNYSTEPKYFEDGLLLR